MQRNALLMVMFLLAACGAATGTTAQPTAALPSALVTAAPAPTAPAPTALPAASTAPAPTALPTSTMPAPTTLPAPSAPQPTAPAAATAAPQPTGAAMNDANNPLVALAISDLATRTGVKASAISVTAITEVEWRDGSLGCARIGQAYTQVIIPGYNIMLEANGKAYNYHTDMHRRAVLCENRTAPSAPKS